MDDSEKSIWQSFKIISDYGETLEKTAYTVYGASELLLPYPKGVIISAITLWLSMLKEKNFRNYVKKVVPDIADYLLSNEYYNALKAGYVGLAKFVSDEDAQICAAALKYYEHAKDIQDFNISTLSSRTFPEKLQPILNRIANESRRLYKELNKHIKI